MNFDNILGTLFRYAGPLAVLAIAGLIIWVFLWARWKLALQPAERDWSVLAQNLMNELALGDNAQVRTVILCAFDKVKQFYREEKR